MSQINGYIEVNGVINKVTSVEDLKKIAESLGKDFKEMNKDELERLCKAPGHRDYVDDCGIVYNENNVLWRANEKSYDLEQYKVKNGTIAIGNSAFYNYFRKGNDLGEKKPRHVGKVYIPESVIAIGEWAFRNNFISEVIIPDTVQYIGRGAFSNCANWSTYINIVLPEKLRFLEAKAFQMNKNLRSVIFKSNIEEIGSNIFKGCNFLQYVYIPDSVTSVGSGIFDECPNFKAIYIPTGSIEKFRNFFPFDIDKLVEVDDIPDFNQKDGNQE